MSKVLFWDFEGTLARREPDWKLAEGALEVLGSLSSKGWRHVLVADETVDLSTVCEQLGLSPHLEKIFDAGTVGAAKPDPSYLKRVFERVESFDEAFVVGDSVLADVAAARGASLPSILVGDASPLAQFCVETLAEIPLALETWNSMRRSFLF